MDAVPVRVFFSQVLVLPENGQQVLVDRTLGYQLQLRGYSRRYDCRRARRPPSQLEPRFPTLVFSHFVLLIFNILYVVNIEVFCSNVRNVFRSDSIIFIDDNLTQKFI